MKSFKKVIRKIAAGVLTLVIALGTGAIGAWAGPIIGPLNGPVNAPPPGSSQPPADYVLRSAPLISPMFRGLADMVDGANILIIEDYAPWADINHNRIIQNFGHTVKIGMASVNSVDLTQYDLVVISNDQPQSVYNEYPAARPALEAYVAQGGALVFGACDMGWASGLMDETLPGGLVKRNVYENNNKLADDAHPVVTGELTDGQTLFNADLRNNYCSHTVFDTETLPEGGSVILTDEYGRATLVEYPIGAGWVIASGLTWEHALTYSEAGPYAIKAYDDLIAYGLFLADSKLTFTISSAVVYPGERADITISVKNNKGISGFDFKLAFENNGTIENVNPIEINPITGGLFKPGEDMTDVTDGLFVSNLDEENEFAVIDWNTENVITQVWTMPWDMTAVRDDLYVISFDVSEMAEPGVYNLTLDGVVVNSEYVDLEYAVKTGTITVLDGNGGGIGGEAFTYGDSLYDDAQNAEGERVYIVSVHDVVKLVHYLQQITQLTLIETDASNTFFDMDTAAHEEIINLTDALKTARWLAGYTLEDNDEMGKGGPTGLDGLNYHPNALRPVR